MSPRRSGGYASASMPSVRTLATLLAAAALALGGVAAVAVAQGGGGAGDQQYQDPFGTTKTSTTKHRSAAAPSKSGKRNGLSQTPNLGSSGTSAASATPAPAASSELPRTGGDTGRVALLGLALLLGGIGLRLRTADERR